MDHLAQAIGDPLHQPFCDLHLSGFEEPQIANTVAAAQEIDHSDGLKVLPRHVEGDGYADDAVGLIMEQ
jgi:hypothetical protein